MQIRIKPNVRLDGWVVDDNLTITKNWTTVPKKQAAALLSSLYKGRQVFESDEAEADEAEVEESVIFAEAVYTEDESDGKN